MTPPTRRSADPAPGSAYSDELYGHLSALVDDRLDASERAALERALEEDPGLRRELDELRAAVAVLRHLPPADAPDDFLRAVQSRIRRRTQGRYFGVATPRYRFQIEAVFNILLIALLFALYLLATPAADPPPVPLRERPAAPTQPAAPDQPAGPARPGAPTAPAGPGPRPAP